MSTTEIGRSAEAATADYLEGLGYKLLLRNWRTRWHEVDIVAQSEQGVHFVEVKYRRSHNYGSGFDYITRDKSNRLRRAALNWVQQNRYKGHYQIDVVSVSGPLDNLTLEYLPNAVEDY